MDSEQRETFFGFLDAVEALPDASMTEGPDGDRLREYWIVRDVDMRLRLSALSQSDWEHVLARVDPFEGRPLSPEQRRQRADQLGGALRDVSLPLVDIIIPGFNYDGPAIPRSQPSLCGWYRFTTTPKRVLPRMAPVFIQHPERGVVRHFLLSFEAVPPESLERLRDIFSLAHVDDAGPDDDVGGAPPEMPPLAPGGAGLLRVVRMAAAPIEEGASGLSEFGYEQTQSEEPPQQVVIQ